MINKQKEKQKMNPITIVLIVLGVVVCIWIIYILLRTFMCTTCGSNQQQQQQQHQATPEPLNDAADDKILSNSTDKIILFYAPWCGFCRRFIPEWNKFVKQNQTKITPIAINGDNFNKTLKRYSVSGFPTVILQTSNGSTVVKYDKEMTADAILNWLSTKTV